jgi:predicted small lipoprotein YifL
MQTVKATLLNLICVALLGACGLKGPLYLPTENPDSKTNIEQDSTPATDAAEDDEDAEKDTGKKAVSG